MENNRIEPDSGETSNKKAKKTKIARKLSVGILALFYIALGIAWVLLSGPETNTRFLYNNPLKELISSLGLAVAGAFACVLLWRAASMHKTWRQLVYVVLPIIFVYTQSPFAGLVLKLSELNWLCRQQDRQYKRLTSFRLTRLLGSPKRQQTS